MTKPEISIILPCLNEERSIEFCIDKINRVLKKNSLNSEILVVDNGSTDNSVNLIKTKKVRLIVEPKKGYGNAYNAGIKNARGKFVIMVDLDGSYEYNEIPKFIEELRSGHDFVLGNRFNNKMEKGAMPIVNKFGNAVIRMLLRVNGIKTKEVCTGFIGIKKEFLEKLNLKQPGMEFSSEVLVKTKKNGLKIKEIDINYYQRIGKPKLRRIRDGFRHFRFLLAESLKSV